MPAAAPHHLRIQNLSSDTVMYSCTLGRVQTATAKHSRTQASPGTPAGSWPLPGPTPNSCLRHLPDQPLEAKSSQGSSPGPRLPVLRLWGPSTFPKMIAKLQPWFVGFIPFHSKGFRGNVQLTGPRMSLKIKQLTPQRVKLMQSFIYIYSFLLSQSGRGGRLRGFAEKGCMYRGSPGRGVRLWLRLVKGTRVTPASASEPGERSGRHFPSQENVVSFL